MLISRDVCLQIVAIMEQRQQRRLTMCDPDPRGKRIGHEDALAKVRLRSTDLICVRKKQTDHHGEGESGWPEWTGPAGAVAEV